jgi:hypothetical protein
MQLQSHMIRIAKFPSNLIRNEKVQEINIEGLQLDLKGKTKVQKYITTWGLKFWTRKHKD